MYYLFFFFFLFSSAIGMEPVVMTDETAPLITPQPICMTDQEAPSILFDGTRRYYDNESYKNVRKEAIKRCLFDTAYVTTCAACAGAMCGGGLGGGCIYMLTCNDLGCCIFTQVQGGLFLDWAFLCCLPASTTSLAVTSIACCCQERREIADDPNKVRWVGPLKISPEMCKAASENKTIWIKKDELQQLLKTAENKPVHDDDEGLLQGIRKLTACYYSSEQTHLKLVQDRLHERSAALDVSVAANVLHTLRKRNMPRDLIKHLFHYINFGKTELATLTWISEKELFYLLNRLTYQDSYPQICTTYANHILLAQNGWLSFTQSEKYPIKCDAKYFDTSAFPFELTYGKHQAPTVYLPYSPVLAHYYKFEKDPEYTDTRDQIIRKLLELRSSIMTERNRDKNLVPIEL